MLTAHEIKDIVQSGEGYNAEFKVSVPSKVREITEEVCAFANAAGGVLIIGVNDNNEIVGAQVDNAKRSAIQNSISEISPHLNCPLYKVNVDDTFVWVIEVVSGLQKPYTFSGGIYVRQGPNSQKIKSVEQMRDFFQQSNRIYFDEGQCPDFRTDKDIDNLFFDEFRISAGMSSAVSRDQIFQNLKLLNPEGFFKNGAVLFFGSSPEFFFEKAVIRCVAFEGIDKGYIIDDKVFGGPLMRQYQQAMQWLKSKLNVRYEIVGSGPRKEIWEIPETALKEVIINALSHRDYYDKGARTTIEFFRNRVEFTNPGGLVSAVSPAEFGTKSHSRNPLIFGLFERIDMVEQIGSGIIRIKNAMHESGLPEPVFKTEGMFTVVLQRRYTGDPSIALEQESEIYREKTAETREKTAETREKTREKILKFISENNNITISELSDLVGITIKGVEYQITQLKRAGLLHRVGPDKGGFWVIMKNT